MAKRRRWDTDERLVGVADAGGATDDVARLLAMTREAGWITEVRETRSGRDVILDVVTGVMRGDNAFATHGHLVRIRILGG